MPAETTKTLNPLPFQDLEPHRFEDLVRQIVYDFRNWRSLEPTGRLGSDDGYDARGFEAVLSDPEPIEEENDEAEALAQTSEDRLWQIQCKREKSVTPAKIAGYVDEMLKADGPTAYGVIFAAPCDFSKKTRDKFAEKLRAKGVQEFYMWGKADLEDMLLQPKNDHLLYAYFGISLAIRRRSKRTEIRNILSIKRKAAKHLGLVDQQSGHKEVLLRDVADTKYPYSGNVPDFKSKPPWKLYQFFGHYHAGIEVVVVRFYAYREIDPQTGELVKFDYSEEFNLARPHDDPWEKQDRGNSQYRGYHYWNHNFKDNNRAYFEFIRHIPYERIIDIDPLGDPIAKCPHVFVDLKNGFFFEEDGYAILRGENAWASAQYISEAYEKLRAKIFPDKFPEVKEDSPVLNQRPSSQT